MDVNNSISRVIRVLIAKPEDSSKHINWRASVASETLTGVKMKKIGDVDLFGERAKRARHYQG